MIGEIGIETAGRSERRIGDRETQSGAGEGEAKILLDFYYFSNLLFAIC